MSRWINNYRNAAISVASALLVLIGSGSFSVAQTIGHFPKKLTSTAGADQSASSIEWRPCGGGVECGVLHVPLDYVRPHGASIEIALARLRAVDEANRIGSLVVNPGGPGDSGVEFIRSIAQVPAGGPLDRFDIVSFDPRGVGESGAIGCLADARLDAYFAADTTPDSDLEEQRLIELNREFAAGCARRHPDLLAHIDTVSVARDMDRLRVALREPRLNFLGISYGSYLGTTYAELFPGRIRTMALDSILDHSLAFDDLVVTQAVALERAFDRFVRGCRANPACPLAGRNVGRVFDRVVARVERDPLPAPRATNPRPVRPSDVMRVTRRLLALLQSPGRQDWMTLADAIAGAEDGDGSIFRELADRFVSRATDGSYDPGHGADRAITCLSFPPVARNAGGVAAIAARAGRVAPRMGPDYVWSMIPPCIAWPRPVADPPHRLRVEGRPAILLVNLIFDPNDAYEWALSVAQQIPSSVLLTHTGDGHVAYFRSACVRRYVDRYLTTERLGLDRVCE